jgi:hypothetical protein
MTPLPQPLPATHRPAFFAGEVLHADDLADVAAVERSLRWLHNRALHGWGIGLGLAAVGARGAKSVSVGEGYAIDAAGRDLVLEVAVTLAVPPVAAGPDGRPADYLLVIAYTEDDAATVELRDGACATLGAVRRRDDPTVAWRVPQAVRDGLDLVLGAAQVAGCALAGPLVTAGVRRGLGAIPSPHVATGTDDTVWSAWAPDGVPAGVMATVDTSGGGFGDTPSYQVAIQGEREAIASSSDRFVIDGHPHVARAGMLSFDVVVPLPAGVINPGTSNMLEVNPPGRDALAWVNGGLHWKVQWIGVEAT